MKRSNDLTQSTLQESLCLSAFPSLMEEVAAVVKVLGKRRGTDGKKNQSETLLERHSSNCYIDPATTAPISEPAEVPSQYFFLIQSPMTTLFQDGSAPVGDSSAPNNRV